MVRRVADINHAGGPVEAGIQCFAEKLRMLSVDSTLKKKINIKFLRLMAKKDDDFALGVNSGVVVVVVFARCNSVTRENQGGFNRSSSGETHRSETARQF